MWHIEYRLTLIFDHQNNHDQNNQRMSLFQLYNYIYKGKLLRWICHRLNIRKCVCREYEFHVFSNCQKLHSILRRISIWNLNKMLNNFNIYTEVFEDTIYAQNIQPLLSVTYICTASNLNGRWQKIYMLLHFV